MPEDGGMILYGSSLSPYVRKVLVMAAELGIEVANVPTPPGSDDAAFRECSPFGKIPGLRDGDFVLSDSSAIAVYLDAKYPGGGLVPAEPRARARAAWFEEFADGILFPAIAQMFFNRIVSPRFLKVPGDLAAAEKAEREQVPPLLDWLETQIPPSGHLLEDRLTLADIAVASPLVNLRHLGIAIDGARHPRLASYVEKQFARPSFAALIDKEAAFLARFA